MPDWKWTDPRERAAQLVAEDRLTDIQIAAKVGIAERSLERWKLVPEFRARVQEHVAKFRERITSEGLAQKENRVAFIRSRLAALRGIVRSRGKLPDHQTAPGETITQKGLQTREVKSLRVTVPSTDPELGDREALELIEEYAIDTATLSEERALLQHLATEMGQWKKQVEVEVSGEVSIVDILRARRARWEAKEQAEQPKVDAPASKSPETTEEE